MGKEIAAEGGLMAYELIAGKDIKKDYSSVTEKVEISTSRYDTPGKMTFSIVNKGLENLQLGSVVYLKSGKTKMFKGYIFKREDSFDGVASFTAYDQVRYMKANASYAFSNVELAAIIKKIAGDFNLKVGVLAKTGYKFPSLIKENTGCMDIVFEALYQTIIQTGKIYNFFDDYGELTLKEAKDMYINKLIGNASLVIDYTFMQDIDSDTYNRIKLVKKNKESGRADTYIIQDGDTIKKWGLLQYYDEVTDDLNAAQIKLLCDQYLKYYNRISKTISIDAIGVPDLRAGMIVPIRIKEIGDLKKTAFLLAEKVTHTFEGESHTMNVEVKDFRNLKG